MASLLERISLPPDVALGVGPHRRKVNRAASGHASAPYNRSKRPHRGDVNDNWKHDMFDSPSLKDRLTNAPDGVPKVNFGSAEKALNEATGIADKAGLSIKGASTRGNVVRVSGLAAKVTAADVKVFFEQCGSITSVEADPQSSVGNPIMRITYKQEKHARDAVAKFHNQIADGRTLQVTIAGAINASLPARIGAAILEGSVDVLMADEQQPTGSKLRSDELLAKNTRAHVLVAPPGANPKDYTQRPARGGRGRGGRDRGRGRGRKGRSD